jgi:hypothetical protein
MLSEHDHTKLAYTSGLRRLLRHFHYYSFFIFQKYEEFLNFTCQRITTLTIICTYNMSKIKDLWDECNNTIYTSRSIYFKIYLWLKLCIKDVWINPCLQGGCLRRATGGLRSRSTPERPGRRSMLAESAGVLKSSDSGWNYYELDVIFS